MFRSYTMPLALVMIPALLAGCGGGADSAESEPEAAEPAEAMGEMGAAEATVALLNPNLATEDELTSVPGITVEAAEAVVGGRPYLRAADLHAVLSGAIGDEAGEGVYGYVLVPIYLNRGTREEILPFPGLCDRMAHEFEEYRPYTDLDQFRMEIGKYVDEDEVARFERYVTLN